MKHIYFTVFLILILISCKNELQTTKLSTEGTPTVEVKHSAGDLWSSSDHFLPLPVNIASFGNKEVLLICPRISKGKKLDITPIGAVSYTENDSLHTMIMALPYDKSKRSISVDDFDEFSTIHSSAKWIIEQYLVNRLGTNQTRIKSWENETMAINYLLNQE